MLSPLWQLDDPDVDDEHEWILSGSGSELFTTAHSSGITYSNGKVMVIFLMS